jgi:hypothetical protein
MRVLDLPLVVFGLSFFLLWLSTRVGAALRKRRDLTQEAREDFNLVQAAMLTLLGLLVGFTFSMAVSRYDQRKNFEEAEANAIGTEFVRADLLAAPDAAKLRALLRSYLDQRVLFYSTRDPQELAQVNARTARLQSELWAAVAPQAAAQPTAISAMVAAGMNDVLNSQGYAQAAWWNRIPLAAWLLMTMIAFCCTMSIGYGARNPKADPVLLLVLPLVLSLSFFLIADIDSPNGGVIRVSSQNLASLAQSLRVQ